MGRDCFIQNHVDLDPGPGFLDYACGSLGYDGDRGADFRVADYVAMERGVAVLAAAPGVVRAVRDGMSDDGVRDGDRSAIGDRWAGNAVVVEHGNGWETQYSHLRRGSVAVQPGDRVEAGRKLGLIGQSGNAEFPHVEFAVRHHGEPIDPFVGPAPFKACGDAGAPLWTAEAAARLPYTPTGLLGAGFAPQTPQADQARRGAYAGPVGRAAPALAFWIEAFGARAGDRMRLRILSPDGRALFDAHAEAAKNYAVMFLAGEAAAAFRNPSSGWPPGRYRGLFALMRDGRPVVEAERTLEVAP